MSLSGRHMFDTVNEPKTPNWKLRFVLAVVSISVAAGAFSMWRMTQMPLRSFRGPLPQLSSSQSELAANLAADVHYLSETIGERNMRRAGSLEKTADYLHRTLANFGYSTSEQHYRVGDRAVSNLEATLTGSVPTEGTIIVGAHYDSVEGTVGANDNATGVAAVLELARMLRQAKLRRNVRFVLFVNEEPPYFQTAQMGSMVYAKKLRDEGLTISAMLSVETIGFYSEIPGSQKYPPVLSIFYPSRGDFIGFVGNTESRDLVRRAVRIFRSDAEFPSEGVAAPSTWPGIGWSDQWSFWQQGYPAIMITDTAAFRYPYYHRIDDTSEKIDYTRMAIVVEGLRSVVARLADQN